MRIGSARSVGLLAVCACFVACAGSRETPARTIVNAGAVGAAVGEPTLRYVGTEVWGSHDADPWGSECDVLELRNDTLRTWTYHSHGRDSVPGFVSVWLGWEWRPRLEALSCGTGAREWRLEPGERRLIRLTSAGRLSIAEVWLCAEHGSMDFTVASGPYMPPERVIDGVSNRSRELWTMPRHEYSDALRRADLCRALGARSSR